MLLDEELELELLDELELLEDEEDELELLEEDELLLFES